MHNSKFFAKKLFKKSSIVATALTVGVCSAGVLAQSHELSPDTKLEGNFGKSDPTVEVQYRFSDLQGLSGGQFRLHYDADRVSVADLSNCLSNLPKTHDGSFSVCNDISDKGFIQFVVLDFGRNNKIGDDVLGSVKFVKKSGDGGDLQQAFSLRDVRLAGPDGKHLKPVGRSSADVQLEILR